MREFNGIEHMDFNGIYYTVTFLDAISQNPMVFRHLGVLEAG